MNVFQTLTIELETPEEVRAMQLVINEGGRAFGNFLAFPGVWRDANDPAELRNVLATLESLAKRAGTKR